ncbi:hypothetical protein BZG36_02300 [Bifiguratus adelaidae]|uniref:Uncharacterized protein n=1 Tax=Bifiguratus adelaidae TaxID=1938954 RepID=A0A261Y3R3_9FUNG|nr:hypothetical protein BZG36_02300 [Bifiguratus adelaidae]
MVVGRPPTSLAKRVHHWVVSHGLRRRSLLIFSIFAILIYIFIFRRQDSPHRILAHLEDEWAERLFPAKASARTGWTLWRDSVQPAEKEEFNFHQYSCENTPLPLHLVRRLIRERVLAEGYYVGRSRRYMDDLEVKDNRPYLLFASSPPRRGFKPRPQNIKLRPGQPYCVRIVIPPTMDPEILEDPQREEYVPIAGSYWDSIMVDLTQRETGIELSMNATQWDGHQKLAEGFAQLPYETRVQLSHDRRPLSDVVQPPQYPHEAVARHATHVYETELRIMDTGTFDLAVTLEYIDGRWNFEAAPIIPYEPYDIPLPFDTTFSVHLLDDQPLKQAYKKPIHAAHQKLTDSTYLNHFNLPFCNTSYAPGRWLNIELFPDRGPGEEPAALDAEGNFWAPYACRLRQYTYADFTKCLTERYPLIHWFGDSNSRRAIKKIVTAGEWCRDLPAIAGDEENLRICHCEDYTQPDWNYTLFNPALRANRIALGPNDSRPEIWFYKWDGLTNLNSPPWEENFLEYPNASELVQYEKEAKVDYDWLQLHNITPTSVGVPPKPAPRRNGPQYRKRWYLTRAPPSIAIISLGNWDTAWLPYVEYQENVRKLVGYLKQRYMPYGTQIIYRPPQYFCCRVDLSDWKRRLSTLRVEAYDRFARDLLVREVGAVVWDVYALGKGRSEHLRLGSLDCPSNHVGSDVVEVENQLLMNGLCGGWKLGGDVMAGR